MEIESRTGAKELESRWNDNSSERMGLRWKERKRVTRATTTDEESAKKGR